MNQWLTETDLLEQYNISRDVLTATVWNGELRVYKQGDSFTAIDIPRKTKAECKKEFRGWGYPLDETLRGLDAVFSKMRYCFRGDLEGFEPTPEEVPKLISILEDAESTHVNRYEALKALLPVMRFRRADVKAWDKARGKVQKSPASIKRIAAQKDKEKARTIAAEYIKDKSKGEIPHIYEAEKLIKKHLSMMYKGKHTIHDWIKEVFPKESRATGQGRPKKE